MNSSRLVAYLIAAGLPVANVTNRDNTKANLVITYTRTLTTAEQTTADAIVAAYDPGVFANTWVNAVADAQSVNGTAVTSLSSSDTRKLMALVCLLNGWVDDNGNILIPAIVQP